MKKLIALTLLTFTGLTAAADISLGYHDGTDVPLISIHVAGNLTQVRYAPSSGEVKCGTFRKDLCGKENQVKYVQVDFPSSSCSLVRNTLASCNDDLGNPNSARAILNNGGVVNLGQFAATVELGELNKLELSDGAFSPSMTPYVNVQIWGDRADGLDPLIQGGYSGSMFGGSTYQVVTTSLFN